MTHAMNQEQDGKSIWSAKGNVKYTSITSGASNWKQGNLEVVENSAGQFSCVMKFACGHPKVFQLSNNIKGITMPVSKDRATISLKDGGLISMNKADPLRVQALENLVQSIKATGKLKNGLTPLKGNPKMGLSTPQKPRESQLWTKFPQSEPAKLFSSFKRSSSPQRSRFKTTPKKAKEAILATEFEDKMPQNFPLFADENEIDEDDKENVGHRKDDHILNGERRSVLQMRKEGGGSLFLTSYKEKENLLAEKKNNTPNIQLSTNFYGRGAQMVTQSVADNLKRSQPKRSFSTSNFSETEKKTFQFKDRHFSFKKTSLFSSLPTKPLQGFSNLGNTCYMNAILQALFGLRSFSQDLLSEDILRNLPQKSLYKALAQLLTAKQTHKPRDIMESRLRDVKVAISQSATRFLGYLQHDAHEFLCQCLDQLKEEVETLNKAVAEIYRDAENAPKYFSTTENNLEFGIMHTVKCLRCNETVTKEEEFHDLSVETPRRSGEHDVTIQVALDQFLHEEEIEYTCEKCQSNQALLTHKFTKLPRYLILHLKRYTFHVESNSNGKSQQRIKIPRYLTLEKHRQSNEQRMALVEKMLNVADKTQSGGKEKENLAIRKRLSYEMDESSNIRLTDVKRAKTCSEEATFSSDDDISLLPMETSQRITLPPGENYIPIIGGTGDACIQTDGVAVEGAEMDFGDTRIVINEGTDSGTDSTIVIEDERGTGNHVNGGGDAFQTMNGGDEGDKKEPSLEELIAKEEEDMKRATELSLQEAMNKEKEEEEAIRKAQELSLMEYQKTSPEVYIPKLDEQSPSGPLYSESEWKELLRNAEDGHLAESYELTGVVSHIGSSSTVGHYLTDVYCEKTRTWLSYDDSDVRKISASTVREERQRTGYIFFYKRVD